MDLVFTTIRKKNPLDNIKTPSINNRNFQSSTTDNIDKEIVMNSLKYGMIQRVMNIKNCSTCGK